MTQEYGEYGFMPTVENVEWDGETLLMETIDSNDESDLIGLPGEPLQRVADTKSDEQIEKLRLWSDS